jgi:hypothetical protein
MEDRGMIGQSFDGQKKVQEIKIDPKKQGVSIIVMTNDLGS